jgi:hypothetical protein
MPQLVRNAWRVGRDIADHRPTLLRLAPAYQAGLDARHGVGGDASISAERAICPLLCLTGTDDQVWPSGPMASALLERRGRAGVRVAAADEHVSYSDAGHLIRLGVLPTDAQWTGGIALGGTRDAVAAAQREATARVLAFLREMTAVAKLDAGRPSAMS